MIRHATKAVATSMLAVSMLLIISSDAWAQRVRTRGYTNYYGAPSVRFTYPRTYYGTRYYSTPYNYGNRFYGSYYVPGYGAYYGNRYYGSTFYGNRYNPGIVGPRSNLYGNRFYYPRW